MQSIATDHPLRCLPVEVEMLLPLAVAVTVGVVVGEEAE